MVNSLARDKLSWATENAMVLNKKYFPEDEHNVNKIVERCGNNGSDSDSDKHKTKDRHLGKEMHGKNTNLTNFNC